ncbi:MAG: FliM/FliN family flagellar motor switch protein [Terracidiphilus sp.]
MTNYIDCWISVASALFSQALTGEPELAESPVNPAAAGAVGFAAILTGDEVGRFTVFLDPSILAASLVGEGTNQKAGWNELLREVADAAAGELLARTGRKCHVETFEETNAVIQVSRGFQLKSHETSWAIGVRDELCAFETEPQPARSSTVSETPPATTAAAPPVGTYQGIELLLDVELEAALRFGCRELPLGEILDMGPGDVVELDRHVTDPVDLIVGDKIVARGEVVLVNGNFGLRVTEVATPRKRLESIRCLF